MAGGGGRVFPQGFIKAKQQQNSKQSRRSTKARRISQVGGREDNTGTERATPAAGQRPARAELGRTFVPLANPPSTWTPENSHGL